MKNYKNIFAASVFFCVLTGVVATASAQDSKPGFATVVRIEGNCTYSLDNGVVWHPLVPGKNLAAGSQIRTSDNGVVDVILGKAIDLPQAKWAPERISLARDQQVRGMITYTPSAEQNVVRLTPNTTLAIDKLNTTDTGADTVSDTELDLKQGKIFASVKKLSGASQYTVKIPNGIAGVRGTKFSISVDGTVVVFETTSGGLVLSLTSANGTTQTFQILEGQLLDPATGSPAPIPAALNGILNRIFTALPTLYIESVNKTYDRTVTYVSPTTGFHASSSSSDSGGSMESSGVVGGSSGSVSIGLPSGGRGGFIQP
jgi:hypothetical protein